MNKLKFIGTGGAFNTTLGNNGAFYKRERHLFLIDCGSLTFDRLRRFGVLDDVDYVSVLMTHMHSDHVGSLGDLILYGYYSMGKFGFSNVTVFAPSELGVPDYLNRVGVTREKYMLEEFNTHVQMELIGGSRIYAEKVCVDHVVELECFGYEMMVENDYIYYSGDSNMIPDRVLSRLLNGEYDVFYQDTCRAEYPGNVHLPLSLLETMIPISARGVVHCMHLDEGFDAERAERGGFNVVRSIEEVGDY